jgi:hypothetical protein
MARQQTGTKTEARVALDDETAVDGFTERDPQATIFMSFRGPPGPAATSCGNRP